MAVSPARSQPREQATESAARASARLTRRHADVAEVIGLIPAMRGIKQIHASGRAL
jgi:hypothetical protein